MKILLDTNIFLDVILKREKYYKDSTRIWSLVSEKKIIGYISAISVNNLYYILKRIIDLKLVRKIIDQIIEEFEIIPLTKEILKQSRTIGNKDYEDIIQCYSAINSNCNFIITCNKTDFPKTGIRIFNPQEFLTEIQ